jgi:hypothetical protein
VKIVVLDGYALNPGDLSWDRLKSLGEVEIYDRTPEPLILERASGAEVLLTNKTPLDKTTLSSLSGSLFLTFPQLNARICGRTSAATEIFTLF